MIHFDDHPILKNNMSTLKETSKDDHDSSNIEYMTHSNREAVHFDGVKDEYIKPLNLSEAPRSNDALFVNRKQELVFVEFKNGFMDGEKKYAVRKKIYDSIIILTDILNKGISEIKENMEYILVYNEDVNDDEREVLNKKAYVRQSPAFDSIAKGVSKMANDEYVCFGIKMFEGYCFKKVHTYTKKEFEQYLENN